MPDLIVNKNRERLPPARPTTWDPFEAMKEMLHFDPFGETAAPVFLEETPFSPSFEVKETRDAYVFKGDVPGVKQQHLDVTVSSGRLVVTGTRECERREEGDTLYTDERSYGSFARRFTLPEDVDEGLISAELHDGVVTITAPKLTERRARIIEIHGTENARKAI